jgi:hypothetical protein
LSALPAGDLPTVLDTDLVAAAALAPAWSLAPASPMPLLLPVYYHWEFRTGVGGDFASLAAALRPPAAPDHSGPIDISRPGFPLPQGFPAGATPKVGGALRPLHSPDDMPAWPTGTLPAFQDGLAAIVSAPRSNAIKWCWWWTW